MPNYFIYLCLVSLVFFLCSFSCLFELFFLRFCSGFSSFAFEFQFSSFCVYSLFTQFYIIHTHQQLSSSMWSPPIHLFHLLYKLLIDHCLDSSVPSSVFQPFLLLLMLIKMHYLRSCRWMSLSCLHASWYVLCFPQK